MLEFLASIGAMLALAWLAATAQTTGGSVGWATVTVVAAGLSWLERPRGPVRGWFRIGDRPRAAPPTARRMADDRFWQIVDATTEHEGDPDLQGTILALALGRLPASDIAAFDAAYRAMLARARTWDCWGAVYVANGGAGDDGFEYACSWLISKGRRVFEAVLDDPDGLAATLDAPGYRLHPEEGLGFEEFADMARQAWAAKASCPPQEMPFDPAVTFDEPSGAPWDEADLPARFPRLWARFGETPLG